MARDVSYEFDPFELAGVSREDVQDPDAVLESVASYVQSQVLDDTGRGISAVYGTKWSGLNKDYKKTKQAKGGAPVANLELFGDMLLAVKTETKTNTVRIFVEDDQSDKADGHNNHSGESSLPLRRFIPAESETFRSGINKEIISIVKEAVKEGPSLTEQALEELVNEGLTVGLRRES